MEEEKITFTKFVNYIFKCDMTKTPNQVEQMAKLVAILIAILIWLIFHIGVKR